MRHPDEDVQIGDMFTVASPFLAMSAAYDPAQVGLKKRAQVDLQQDASLWARTLVELAGTLALPLPDVYAMDGEAGQTTLLNVRHRNGPRPTLLLGPPTMRRNSFDLVFDLAPHFSFLRPERFPKVALRTPPILQGVLGVLRALGRPNGGPTLEGEAGRGVVEVAARVGELLRAVGVAAAAVGPEVRVARRVAGVARAVRSAHSWGRLPLWGRRRRATP